MSIFQYLINNNALIPENPEGNIEYKLRLDLKQEQNIKKTASQMKWRLSEGYHQNYPLEFDFPISTLTELSIKFTYPDGKLVDFRNIDHSFTLRIIEKVIKPYNTGINSKDTSYYESLKENN